MRTDFFSEDFLGDLIVMIIGLVILGVGANLIIAGAKLSNTNYFMTIILIVIGAVLLYYSGIILRSLISRIHDRRNRPS